MAAPIRPRPPALHAFVAIGVFAAALCGTAAVDLARPSKPPPVGGEEEIELRAAASRARFADGSAMALAEACLRDRATVRRKILPRYAAALWTAFSRLPGKTAVGGGFVHLRDRIPTRTVSDADLAVRATGPSRRSSAAF